MRTAPSPTRARRKGRRTAHALTAVYGAPWRRSLGPAGLVLGRATTDAAGARELGPTGIGIADDEISRRHVELTYVESSDAFRIQDLGSTNGTFLNGVRIDTDYLSPGDVVRIGATLLVYGQAPVAPGFDADAVAVGESIGRRNAEYLADVAAPGDTPVLVRGPSGAGKERLARRLHEQSGRRGPLVALNSGSLHREMIGSELFGHVKGAYSGAHGARAGLFAAAEGGTLFLDEIAELPLEQQPMLLRALQEKRIRPLGSDVEQPVDVRVIAASHQDLEACVRAGTFREDLFARLAGVVIELPGLAARREEILPLFRGMVGEGAPPLALDAAEALLLYGWPRNVRELEHAAQQVRLFMRHVPEIDADLLPPSIGGGPGEASPSPASPAPEAALDGPPAAMPSKDELIALLRAHGGKVAGVARALGRHRQQVYRMLEAHQVSPDEFRS